jgi:outer membrane protein TolC
MLFFDFSPTQADEAVRSRVPHRKRKRGPLYSGRLNGPLSVFSLLLFVFGLPLAARAQQMPGTPIPATMSQAIQLPASGRTAQSAGSVNSQQTPSPEGGASVVQPSVTVTGNYQGSIVTEVPKGPLRLSLSDAIKRGLQANLGIITASVSSASVRAQRLRALSSLLPQLTATAGATETQVNLASFGFGSLPATAGMAFPAVVGPFHFVQAQGNLNWNALSITDLRNYKAAKDVEHATQFSERDARELVVLAVGGTYLQVVSAGARVESQRAQVNYAQAIYDMANTQLSAGTNTRVDVTRSFVQLQTEQERLLSLQGDYEQQKIAFARLIGVPQDTDIVFIQPLESAATGPVDEVGALRSALDHRWDLRSAGAQLQAAEHALSAAHAERYPTLSFSGDYGAMGVDPTNAHGVFAATGSVSIPVFDGGRIRADIQQAEATLRQRQAEYQDQKEKVEQDVRNALIQLRTAIGQLKLAQSNRQYARETLQQVQDRFSAGVTNTVEVVQAQQQEASAENDYISSLFAVNLARLTLARATGTAETDLTSLFPRPKQ